MRHPLLFALFWFWAGALSAQNATVQPGASIHLVGSGKLILRGNLTNNGNVQSADQSAVRFVGDTRSTISGSGGTVLQDMQLAKSNESVELLQSITVNGTLEFVNDANYLLCADDTLTLGPSTGSIVGADVNKYVVTNGEGALLKKQVGASFFYPVGFDQSTYNPVALVNVGGAEDLGIRCRENVLSHANVGTPAAQDAVDASWDLIKPQSNGANISLDLTWSGTDELSGFNRAACFVSQFSNGSWAVVPPNAVTGADPYTTTRHGISTGGTLGVFSATPTVANAGSDVAVCSASSAFLSATGTGTWSVQSGTGGSFGNVNAPNTGFSGVLGQTYTLLWTIDGQLGPWLTSTDAVNVAFEISSTAEAGGNQSICSDGTVTLAASGSNGTGVWSIVSGPATSISQLNDPTAANATFTPTGGAGTYTLRWTVSNLSCPPATDEMVVLVDVPSIVCPSNITRSTDANQCTAAVSYANPTYSDNCGTTIARTGGLASGSVFPKGVSMVEWKATSGAGLMAICQFTVTVVDAQTPTITCPANIVRGADANQCSALVVYANPTFSDNCTPAPTLMFVSGGASGSQFPKGMTTVVWKASDGASPANTATCSFTVTVNDTQLPNLVCPTNITRNTDAGQCHAAATYASPTYSDNCAGGGAAIQSGLPSGSNFPKGVNTVTWKATDAAGLTKTCTFRVTVNDVENPVITCPTVAPTTTTANSCVSAPVMYSPPTATDNCPGAITVIRLSGPVSGSTFPLGTTSIVWRAIDGAGRSSTCSFAVAVTDAALPAISCPNSISVMGSGSPCTATVGYATPTATDNCGVQSVFLLSGQPSGSSFPAGATVNVWRAVDNAGLSATCSFTITVSCGASPDPSGGGENVAAERDGATSNFKLSNFKLSLAPNPATTEVTIFSEKELEADGELTVLDAQGRLRWRQSVATGQQQWHLDLDSRWQSGVYFATLRSGGQATTKRLVVSKL